MSRSSKKGPYIDKRLLEKIAKEKVGSKEIINTYARRSVVSPEMVGFTIGVHNGKIFIPVKVKEEMVGHKLGEFSLTRKFVKHGGKMQRDLEAGQAMAGAAAASGASSPATGEKNKK